MADTKISDLPAASVPFNNTEAAVLVQAGADVKATIAMLAQQLFLAGAHGASVKSLTLNDTSNVQAFSLTFDGTFWNFSGVQFTFTAPLQVALAGLLSSDGSVGISTTITSASLVGKTVTIKDGIITGFA